MSNEEILGHLKHLLGKGEFSDDKRIEALVEALIYLSLELDGARMLEPEEIQELKLILKERVFAKNIKSRVKSTLGWAAAIGGAWLAVKSLGVDFLSNLGGLFR